MQVAVGQDKSNSLVTFNQVEVFFFQFFFPPCQNVTTLEFRLLLLNFFKGVKGAGAPPCPPLAPPVLERENERINSHKLLQIFS